MIGTLINWYIAHFRRNSLANENFMWYENFSDLMIFKFGAASNDNG